MNAVIYARYSSDNQREESIEGQVRECREYAEKNGMDIIGVYTDISFMEVEGAIDSSESLSAGAPTKKQVE